MLKTFLPLISFFVKKPYTNYIFSGSSQRALSYRGKMILIKLFLEKN